MIRVTASIRAILATLAPARQRNHLGHFEDAETRQGRRLAHYTSACVAVILVCLVQDSLVVPDVFPSIVLWALGLAAPLLAIGSFLAHRGRRAASELAVLVAFSSLPLWAFWLLGSSRTDQRVLALYGLTHCFLMFIWYNATFGVRLWRPVLCYVIVCIAGIGMFLRLGALSWQIEFSLGLLVLSAAVMALLSNVFMHRDEHSFVSEGGHLLAAIAAGRHDLWAYDIPSGRVDVLHAAPSGPERSSGMTHEQYLALVHPDDRQYVLESFRSCIELGESRAPYQYRLANQSSGDCCWHEGIGKVVERDLSGKPLTVLGMTNNISDSKQLTRQLQEHAEAIARATRAKSEFLATMSHEIRTPLNGILGMASLLADADLSPGKAEMVSIIRGSGTALLQILNDVLDYSKIEAGKLSLAKAPFEVRQIARHCMQRIDSLAQNKSLATGLTVAADVPLWLSGDAVQLSTILMHLLSNAVKFTSAGRLDLSIFTGGPPARGPGTEAVETLVFEVRDTGIGMDDESRNRLFSPFTQGRGQGFTGECGVGLGLAIARRLVEAFGGSIGFSSEIGRGTCFTVTLPFAVCPPPPAPEPASGKTPRVDGVRILVAEDNPVNQVVLVKMLQRMGYSPSLVNNGLEAVQAAKGGDFDLILMDCEMPVLDGLEATRQIRAVPALRLPIIALSAHSRTDQETLAMAAGMSGYLTKPVTQEGLRDQLCRWL